MVYESFTECYYDLLDLTFKKNAYESAPRGMKIKENLGVKFTIENPRNRLLYIPERKYSVTYAIAELLWYALGENSTQWISNYSDFWTNISDDGKTANSAYGARIFKQHPRIGGGRFKQWDYVVNELKKDPDSRRAVIHIRVPDDHEAKLDVPCTLSLQFFIREKKLHMIANMRSTDLIFGLSYDVPAFTFFQELLALELGVELGSYTHMSNSLHVYEKHFEMCDVMLKNMATNLSMHDPMPALKSFPPVHVLNDIQWTARECCTEKEILDLVGSLSLKDLHDANWMDWSLILIAHRAGKLKLPQLKRELIQSTSFQGYHAFSL